MDVLKTAFLQLINSATSRFKVRPRANEDELYQSFCDFYNKHEAVCKSIIELPGELDSHKRSAVICVSILDLFPLINKNEAEIKEALSYQANEWLALHLSFYNVRVSFPSNYILLPQDANVLGYVSDVYPEQVFDGKTYESNFLFLLRQEQILSRCKFVSANVSSVGHCGLFERCKNNTLYNYLSLSKLFFHYHLMVGEKIKENRRNNGSSDVLKMRND